MGAVCEFVVCNVKFAFKEQTFVHMKRTKAIFGIAKFSTLNKVFFFESPRKLLLFCFLRN